MVITIFSVRTEINTLRKFHFKLATKNSLVLESKYSRLYIDFSLLSIYRLFTQTTNITECVPFQSTHSIKPAKVGSTKIVWLDQGNPVQNEQRPHYQFIGFGLTVVWARGKTLKDGEQTVAARQKNQMEIKLRQRPNLDGERKTSAGERPNSDGERSNLYGRRQYSNRKTPNSDGETKLRGRDQTQMERPN